MWLDVIVDFLLGLIGLSRKTAQEKLGQEEVKDAIDKGTAEAEKKALDAQSKVINLSDTDIDNKLRSEFTRK